MSVFKSRFGAPGVISVIALLFAMIGGAYAASENSSSDKASASAKAKKGPRGPRGPRGPKGPVGPAGPQGPAGPAGAAGAKGAQGAQGERGATGPAGLNGSNGTQGAAGPAGPAGATGPEGSPWTAGGTLPSGETLVGTWAFVVGPENPTFGLAFGKAAISFSIPVPGPGKVGPLSAHRLKQGEEETAECPGSYLEPKAEPGHLCVYTLVELDAGPNVEVDLPANPGSWDIQAGAFVQSFEGEPGGFAQGSWAVTAP